MNGNERARLKRITEYETPLWESGALVGGMDEVGRGPLAGPVVAACVILPREPLIESVTDSKKLSEKKREALYPRILEAANCVGYGVVGHDVIDRINILNATKRAFSMAFEAMETKPAHILVDAVGGLDVKADQTAIIHGDMLSYLIGAASIVAKVKRDAMMRELDAEYPQYGFASNKGYGTAEHIAALRKYGPCPIHRKSFIAKILGTAT